MFFRIPLFYYSVIFVIICCCYYHFLKSEKKQTPVCIDVMCNCNATPPIFQHSPSRRLGHLANWRRFHLRHFDEKTNLSEVVVHTHTNKYYNVKSVYGQLYVQANYIKNDCEIINLMGGSPYCVVRRKLLTTPFHIKCESQFPQFIFERDW